MNLEIMRHRATSPKSFWRAQAELVHWFKFPQKIQTTDKHGLNRWYKGGKLNTCYLAVDNNIENGLGEQVALYFDSPVTNTKYAVTYNQLYQHVTKTAGMLSKLGIKKGDRVIIYMSMVPESLYAMLACARLGAVHCVVFGGFSALELAVRIDDCTPKVILMTSGGKEIDKIIPYKPLVDGALKLALHKIEALVCLQRDFVKATLTDNEFDWQKIVSTSTPHESYAILDATDPLYILYTSGTTGKPKGVVRDNGGHAVSQMFSMRYVYGAHSGDVFWAASDIGWAVGHSYTVYAPLLAGCTTVIFEGKPVRTPDAGTFWRIISEYDVKIFFCAPTAIRAIKKEDPNGELIKNYNLDKFKYILVAGERCDANTLDWLMTHLQKPAIDNWWQSESGYPMISQMMGIEQKNIKPGSAGFAVPSFDICILGEEGEILPANSEGAVCIKYPLPPGCLPHLWNDVPRFKEAYLSQFLGYYFTGDGGYVDEDNYIFITGRIDDVINVAGHRLSTSTMEEVVASHDAVAECAVVGVHDDMKGQIPVAFVVLKTNTTATDAEIEAELVNAVREQIGAVASFRRAVVVKRLPKTRSGKILRKIMRHIADAKSFATPSTIEDITVLAELEQIMREQKIGVMK